MAEGGERRLGIPHEFTLMAALRAHPCAIYSIQTYLAIFKYFHSPTNISTHLEVL
mgnify:CR=1 FL=1